MKEEIFHLIKAAQSGDKSALETLTVTNSGLIWNAVKKFGGRGAEKEDLFQIGAIGLIKAVEKFDLSFDVEFSTYAVPMIFGEIRRFLRDDGIIKVSRSIKETFIKVRYASEKIAGEKGREATISEIAQMLDITEGDVAAALEANREVDSIYRTVNEDDKDGVLVIDKICSGDNNEDKILNTVALRQAMKKLEVRDREILMLRYFKEKTQSEVARIMGLSQVQISRIEKKVLLNLRKNIS